MFPNSSHSFRFPRRAALLFCLGFALVGSGCGRYKRTKQCRALIAQVNPALDDVATITGTGAGAGAGAAGGGTGGVAGASGVAGVSGLGGTGVAPGKPLNVGYLAAAGRYERLAKQLGPMEFATEDMAKTVAEYASVLNSSAQALRALAAAIDANNYPEAERANRDLERLSAREHAAIGRIDAWCAPGA
ncbi:MAG: hypothetical protein ABI627_06965 [Polyangiaceae bacterium]